MKFVMKPLSILTTLAVSAALVCSAGSLLAENTNRDSDQIVTKAYSVAHMPVWTIEHKFDETMLTSYLQACATPKLWSTRGGTASMKVYQQNLKIVVSATPRTHKAIETILDRFPRTEEPAQTGFAGHSS